MSKHHYFTSCAECEKPESNAKGLCQDCALLPQYADERLVDDVGREGEDE
ncbi:hypothetical protein Sbs19_29900 [Sphingobium sp. BS19]|nr:hypothetical protein Sbs19_29900 [Sphingobium sp. BS19]